MARCGHCNKWLVGGIRESDLRFCSIPCHEKGFLCKLVEGIDDDLLVHVIGQVHSQPCPVCRKKGPVDIYVRHNATAFVIHFSWKDTPQVCCRRCGIGHVLRGMAWTFIFGWWHFPAGPIVASWQLINGLKQLFSLPAANVPSERLTMMVKLDLAASLKAGDTL